MITWIGLCAGEIWQYLDQHGEATLQTLFSEINSPEDVILMALGWLGREGYVLIKGEPSDYRVALNPSTPSK